MADQVGKAGPDPNTPKPSMAAGTGVTGVPTAPGTAAEVAAQGFTGVKLQADGQATAGAKGGDVPPGMAPPVSPYKDAKAMGRTPKVVADAKFTAGGEQFKAGETIYLTGDEAVRWARHLVA